MKERARGALRRAVRLGLIVKPTACPACGVEDQELHAHHGRGYDDLLDIDWLCRRCHRVAHGQVSRPERVDGPLTVILVLQGMKAGSFADPETRRLAKRTMAWLRENRPPITYEPTYAGLFNDGLATATTGDGES